MMQRIIEVIVSSKGETTVQTKGFVGGECLQASKFIEQALGASIQDRKTGEFFLADESVRQQVRD